MRCTEFLSFFFEFRILESELQFYHPHSASFVLFFSFFIFQSPFKLSNSDSNLTRAKLAIIVLDCIVLFGFEAVGNRKSRAWLLFAMPWGSCSLSKIWVGGISFWVRGYFLQHYPVQVVAGIHWRLVWMRSQLWWHWSHWEMEYPS